MSEPIRVAVEQRDRTAMIWIQGDLTAAAQEEVQRVYQDAALAGCSRIAVAFREEDHINSAGVGILIGLVMEARKAGQTVRFVHPSPHFRRIFTIVGLSRYAEVFSSLEDAMTTNPDAVQE